MTKSLAPTRLKHLADSTRDQFMLAPTKIAIEKDFNPRNYHLPENRAHLDELKASIREQGVRVPLLVRFDPEAGQAVLVDGECRLRACLELIEDGVPIEAIPTVQVPGGNEADRLIVSLTSNTGKPLSKWEVGSAFQRLVGFGWATDKIATKLGYSERYVKESLELSDAPQDVKELLSQQAVTPSLALQHIRSNGSGAGAALRGEVEKARAKSKPGKKVIAKRKRTVSGVRLLPGEAALVIKALKLAAKQDDEKCAKAAQEAFETMEAAGQR